LGSVQFAFERFFPEETRFLGTEHWTTHTPCDATYWKRLPTGVVVTFEVPDKASAHPVPLWAEYSDYMRYCKTGAEFWDPSPYSELGADMSGGREPFSMPFEIRKEAGQQADQRKERADSVNKADAGGIGELSQ